MLATIVKNLALAAGAFACIIGFCMYKIWFANYVIRRTLDKRDIQSILIFSVNIALGFLVVMVVKCNW